MAAGRRPCLVYHRRLRHDHKGIPRRFAGKRPGLAGGNLFERAADVDGAGAARVGICPGDRTVEDPVHFVHSGTVAPRCEPPGHAPPYPRAGDAGGGGRRSVQVDRSCRRQVIGGGDPPAHLDRSSEFSQIGGQGGGNSLGAAPGHRPAIGVSCRRQDQGNSARCRRRQACHRVGPEAGKQRPGGIELEPTRDRLGRANRLQSEPSHRHRVAPRRLQRRQRSLEDLIPLRQQRHHRPSITGTVRVEERRRLLERVAQRDCPAAVQRMAQLQVGTHPAEPETLEGELSEERRGGAEGMHRGANVVPVARLDQLLGAGAATDRWRPLQDRDGSAAPGQRDGSCQPVRARTDDDGIKHAAFSHRPRSTGAARIDSPPATGGQRDDDRSERVGEELRRDPGRQRRRSDRRGR